MTKEVNRGYVPTDYYEFGKEKLALLKKAQKDILMLIDQGYPMKGVITFVGDHYMLSKRQRLSLARATSPSIQIMNRKNREIKEGFQDKTIYIDGLNIIITLEVALSHSILLYCMDDTIRDLAGLRGTYKIIDKTDIAIELIGKELKLMGVKEVIFYLDSPVSNTGRLKERIISVLGDMNLLVEVLLVNNADVILENKDYVVTSDAIILNKCISWINLAHRIMLHNWEDYVVIDLHGQAGK